MITKSIKKAGLLGVAAALALGSTTASAVTVNTFVFQGVTWTTTSVDADSMTLRIENALSGGSGNWANIAWLWTLQVDPVGEVTSATITPPGIANDPGELNAHGCEGGDSGKACFSFDPVMALSNDMLFTVDFVGTGLDMEGIFHVKVGFLCDADGSPVGDTPPTIVPKDPPDEQGTQACGSLMSKDIFTDSDSDSDTDSDVPEPGTLGLLGLGLLGFGLSRRRLTR